MQLLYIYVYITYIHYAIYENDVIYAYSPVGLYM